MNLTLPLLKQMMISSDTDTDKNSYRLFSTLIRRVVVDVCNHELKINFPADAYVCHTDKGVSKIHLPGQALRFATKIVAMYQTTFFVTHTEDHVTIHHRIAEKPCKSFIGTYGHLVREIKEYRLPNGDLLPIREFGFPEGLYVANPEREPLEEKEEVEVQKVVVVEPFVQLLNTQTISNTNSMVAPVAGFVPLSEEQKRLLNDRHIKMKHRILFEVFESEVGECKNLPATTTKRDGALIYLSLRPEQRAKLEAYLNAIGLRYELGKTAKTIILFDNVPQQADHKLMTLIEKAVGVKESTVLKIKKQKVASQSPPTTNFPQSVTPTVKDDTGALHKHLSENLKIFDALIQKFQLGMEQSFAIDEIMQVHMKKIMEKKAKEIATVIAQKVVKDNEHIIVLRDDINVFSEPNLIAWIEKGIRDSF